MICPYCKTKFTLRSVNQKFCSLACGEKYRRRHKDNEPLIREFWCAHCNKHVITEGKGDKRTRFCCQSCEKKYWRHPPETWSNNRTWHSFSEYASWERRSND